MLTLKDINEASFGKASFSGYKPGDVDAFIDEVVVTMQHLTEEKNAAIAKLQEINEKNEDMQKKLSVLAEKVESYRGEEDGIKDAVLSAHKMSKLAIKEAELQAAKITDDANKRAELVFMDAKKEATDLLGGARDESARKAKLYAEQVVSKKNELEQLKKQVVAFRTSLMELYKKHLEMINHIPNFRLRNDEAPKEKSTTSENIEMKSNVEEKANTDEASRIPLETYEEISLDYSRKQSINGTQADEGISDVKQTENGRKYVQEYTESLQNAPQ